MLAEKLLKPPSTGPTYIEDVFSTWVYAGSNTSQNIVNGIDLATKGGMTWIKCRVTAYDHILSDTNRGPAKYLASNSTSAEVVNSQDLTAFNTNGFSVGTNARVNNAAYNYVSWTFRKQPKFFDVVTYTGDGNTTQAINHSLGSVPGCIIVKRIDSGTNWFVYHKDLTSYQYSLYLNDTTGQINAGGSQFGANPTSTQFTVGSGYPNSSGGQYVAYVFAHNAGGFGLTGTDNVISCGSVTLDGSGNASVNLGYEPQFVMIKRADNTSAWYMHDTMRGLDLTTYTRLYANTSSAEDTSTPSYIAPSSTGFNLINGFSSAGGAWIYIAIRRGPMKVPTDATKVFKPVAATPSGSQDTVTTGFPTDFIITTERSHSLTGQTFAFDRLRGGTTTRRVYLTTNTTNAETNAAGGSFGLDSNVAVYDNFYGYSGITNPVIYWNFKRAPSFFDEVCYTGTGSATTQAHNLGAVPELMIVKNRGTVVAWKVYHQALGNTNFLELNSTGASSASTTIWNDTTPTSSVFTVGSGAGVNQSGVAQVAYLFATCAGVSKVFSFTGNGSTQTINCGFAGGARFVLLKASSATGGWYVYDTARGMTVLTDPYLQLNSTAAETATLGSVTTVTTGFAVNEAITTGVNTNGVTYIGLAIA